MLVMEHNEIITTCWNKLETCQPFTANEKNVVMNTMQLIDNATLTAAVKVENQWTVNTLVKKAILLYFAISDSTITSCSHTTYYDKISLKFQNWSTQDFQQKKIRAVPGSIVRYPAYIGSNVVIMPSFVNVGAHIGDGTMIDTWSTVGSCAYVGKNCHIAGGAGIGGVLEPVNGTPTIIEDNCFIGARSEIIGGVIIGEGSVLAMGVYIGPSTKIVDRTTGEISFGYIPPGSVVIPGSIQDKNNISIYCAVIAKKVDARTKSKTTLNELLRI